MSSQLPKITPGKPTKGAKTAPKPVSTLLNNSSPEETLRLLSTDTSLPLYVQKSLQGIVDKMNSKKGVQSFYETSKHTPIQVFLSDTITDGMPLRQSNLRMLHEHTRVHEFNICRSPSQHLSASPRTMGKRSAPAIQDPSNTFEKMNRIMMQTLRYIDSVTELEFDIMDIREHDGTIMNDSERLFLSVTCSIFANFSLCTSLNIDLKKLLNFLTGIHTYYQDENPYHNATHAADSLQMLSLLFREPSISFLFTDEEILLSFLCVLSMDVAHAGLTTTSLAALNHPLVAVFGDTATQVHASLLVFLHELFRDENFIFPDVTSNPNSMTIQLIRESLNAVVLNTVPRGRCFLMARLHKISEEGSVKGEDMMYIMAALAVLAESAFALRPRKQCFGMGSKLLIELQREAKEMTRKNVPSSVQQLSSCDPAEFIMETCRLIVRPIADAVSALITMDLLDNLERNTDADTFASERKLVPPPTQEGRATAWIDNSSAVIDILKKATTHANSLDRKASKRAILNASPPRTNAASAAASMDPKAGTASMSLGSPICGNSLVNLGASLSEGDFSHSMRHSNRAEHYFSFLRLYNQCENEGATSSDFFSRIIFLALQLDPSYVANYAKEKYGADGNAAQCGEMARFIMLNEEVPPPPRASRAACRGRTHSPCPRPDPRRMVFFCY
ncbi:cAMP-specific phosphodiesterase [Strigomonas culicis]|uniref:cAMP-specific phosphodiesterase n=1 Tax=Strigomonas culicis TaxID=28005 RepID=S9UP91_9TRYP|nr:cAMP-specific phosphodiesterase [Strigomonas culicis]|eukprot:EPY32692.1 cAMP-specific phosphodiesterase [Strigomonas culicis]